ncbi:NAD(P)/FAD-dependent oxidoreductase [Microbacterium sp. NPDC055910]|uniref:NAD(P)/FAD-dependent oxidoreductase n=1 Tax=Microbacterium sp. NPDC055910 TaxID=3345659 RepID=UPI0035E27090
MGHGTVIVGASQAGVQVAASLRDAGYTESITLIDGAHHEPYQRPPLSKDFLAGTVEAQGLRFRQRDYYETHGITLALGSAAVEVRRVGDGGVVVTEDGTEHPYERLVIAVGAQSRELVLPGAELDGVLTLRDADDADRVRAALETAQDVIVIGGGFIGLEVAASALKHGKSVTVLEAAPRIIGRAVGEETSSWFLDAHRSRGMTIEVDARLVRFHERDGHVSGVELADGRILPADVVVVGIGVVPRTDLAAQLGLGIDNGIVVDEFMVASDGRTLAIGDVANAPNPYDRVRSAMARVRLESVNNAIEQARTAAATILGAPQPYQAVPWFWSNQGDLRLQMAGLNVGHDRVVIRGDQDAPKFSVMYYRGDTLLGADCVNSPVDFMAVKSALMKGQNIPPDAATSDAPLKTLVVDHSIPSGSN